MAKCMEKQIPNPEFCDLKWGLDPQSSPNSDFQKPEGLFPMNGLWVHTFLMLLKGRDPLQLRGSAAPRHLVACSGAAWLH